MNYYFFIIIIIYMHGMHANMPCVESREQIKVRKGEGNKSKNNKSKSTSYGTPLFKHTPNSQ